MEVSWEEVCSSFSDSMRWWAVSGSMMEGQRSLNRDALRYSRESGNVVALRKPSAMHL